MRYASNYAGHTRNPKGMGLAVGVHAVIAIAVMTMPGIDIPERINRVIVGKNIPISPPEPDLKTEPQEETEQKTQPNPRITPQSDPKVPDADHTAGISGFSDGSNFTVGSGIGAEFPFPGEKVTIEPPAPIILPPLLDSRFAQNFQPDYPPAKARLEEEAVIKVKVLVGGDGRAKDIVWVSGPQDSFFETTRKHGLSKWRFKPATRDGVPVESWITLTVRFELQD
jgi:protein TonB